MNSKVLMVVALLFAGSVSANSVEDTKRNLFGFSWEAVNPFAKTEAVKPARFARLKEVVSNNRVATGVAVVATVAVIAAVVAYAKSAKADEVVTEEENFFA